MEHLQKARQLFPFNEIYRTGLARFIVIRAQEDKVFLSSAIDVLRETIVIDPVAFLYGHLIAFESELGLDVIQRFDRFRELSKNGPKIKK